jgi:hypothetical protein
VSQEVKIIPCQAADYLFLTAVVLTPGGIITVHIYTQPEHSMQRAEHT